MPRSLRSEKLSFIGNRHPGMFSVQQCVPKLDDIVAALLGHQQSRSSTTSCSQRRSVSGSIGDPNENRPLNTEPVGFNNCRARAICNNADTKVRPRFKSLFTSMT